MKSKTKLDYKVETKRAYDQYAEVFAKKFAERIPHESISGAIDQFLKLLPGKRILDAGCGAGDHSLIFQNRGFDPLCIDISPEMIRLAAEKGLRAQVADLEALPAFSEKFDGIWAYTSLLHIPKTYVPAVINSLLKLLSPSGALALCVKEGTGEGLEQDDRYPDTARWFTYFTDSEIRALFPSRYMVELTARDSVNARTTFLHYIVTRR